MEQRPDGGRDSSLFAQRAGLIPESLAAMIIGTHSPEEDREEITPRAARQIVAEQLAAYASEEFIERQDIVEQIGELRQLQLLVADAVPQEIDGAQLRVAIATDEFAYLNGEYGPEYIHRTEREIDKWLERLERRLRRDTALSTEAQQDTVRQDIRMIVDRIIESDGLLAEIQRAIQPK